MSNNHAIEIPEPRLSKLFFADARFSFVWLILRLYVGWEWLSAGWEKVVNPAWVGFDAGEPLRGFVTGAIAKMGGAHPSVGSWYGSFLENVVMPHALLFSNLVAYGELLVGVALVLGIFTGIAAFFGAFMNLNYLFAGTVSVNPFLLFIELFLILAWRNAGWFGIDKWLLPKLGVPWQPGKVFRKN